MRWLFPILLSWCLFTTASAEDPVYFADPGLRNAVEWYLNVSDPTPTDMLGLTELMRMGAGMVDITPLLGLTGLELLLLTFNSLDAQAYCSHRQTLVEQNPDMVLFHGPNSSPPTDVIASNGMFPDRVHVTWEPVCNGPNCADKFYQMSRAPSVEGLRTPDQWVAEYPGFR